jgi:hypothetical protein
MQTQKEKPNNVTVNFVCTVTYKGSKEWDITEEEWDAMDSDDKETKMLEMHSDVVENITTKEKGLLKSIYGIMGGSIPPYTSNKQRINNE